MGNQTLGGYETVLKLGKGKYGKTRLSLTADGFNFALKVIEINPKSSKRLMIKDIKQMYSLKHIGITQIKNIVDIAEDRFGLLMQYYNQGNLATHIYRGASKDELIDMRRIAEIIQNLHQLGIVHRDIKPENIFIKENNIFVSDIAVQSVIKGCRIRKLQGSCDYQAPQTFQGNYCYASDVWSLGVVFLQILYAKRIRQLMSLDDLVVPQQHNIQYPSRELIFKIENQTLRNLIASMIAQKPSDRVTINQVVSCLRNLLSSNIITYRKEMLNQNTVDPNQEFVSKKARLFYLNINYECPYINHFNVTGGTIRRIDHYKKRYQVFSRQSIPAGRWEIIAKVLRYGDDNDQVAIGLLAQERKSELTSGDIGQQNSVAYWSNITNQKGHICQNGEWRKEVLPCLRQDVGVFKMIVDTYDGSIEWHIDGKLKGISRFPTSYWNQQFFVFAALMGQDCTIKFMQNETLN